MKVQVLRPEYVEQLPDQLTEGIFYICEGFDLTAHKCCCGCGEDVYNKLSPAKWRLTKMPDGRVSLHPSIGNWKYACKSHYWIRANRVIDAGPMDVGAIEAVQQRDLRDRDRYIAQLNSQSISDRSKSFWGRFCSLVSRTLHCIRALWPWQ
jgi:hypothetical protein